MDLLDTDVLIDVQPGHPPALAWFAALTDLPAVPGFVIMVPGLVTGQPYTR